MSIEKRFDLTISRLISDGHFSKQNDFAKAIGEDASGLTSLKRGVKRLRIDHVQKLKEAVPSFNSEWLLTGEGEIYKIETATNSAEPTSNYVPGNRDISALLEDIESRLDPESVKLVRHLKVEIDELIKERDEANRETTKAKDELIEVLKNIQKKLG